ncbi:MAG: Tic20 family protein [Leptolyngbyaceae cyanobacterium bins.302]|nr:Tic20 family protein [Leptolyngbyaceae cyanobacterium bins.302]
MTWRGSTTVKDRVFASLPYAFPMLEASMFGAFLIAQFPVLAWLLLPLAPFAYVYGLLGSVLGSWTGFVIFFALYVLVVRNDRIHHFIRFNTMQALLIGIVVSLVILVLQLVGILPGSGINYGLASIASNSSLLLLITVLFSTIFIGVMASSIYSIVFAAQGKYGEIPVVSDAAYAQVRY